MIAVFQKISRSIYILSMNTVKTDESQLGAMLAELYP
jgi:hypothetical protein